MDRTRKCARTEGRTNGWTDGRTTTIPTSPAYVARDKNSSEKLAMNIFSKLTWKVCPLK